VPAFADGCELDLRDDRGIVRIVVGTDPEAAAVRERAPVATGLPGHPIVEVLGGGPARLIDLANPADEALFGPADDPASARGLGMTTAVLAPIVAAGRVVGSLALGRGPSGRRFDADDVDVAVDLARRVSLAWHNAVLLTERASILSSLHDALLVSDASGAVVEVNDRWTELTGFTAEESLGHRMPYPWWPLSDDDADVSVRTIVRAAERRERAEHRTLFRRADGSTFVAIASVSPIVDRSSGQQRGFVTSIKDVTAWETARADLASLQRVTAALTAATTVADVAGVVVDEVVARLEVDAAFLVGLAPDGQNLELLASAGPLGSGVADAGPFPVSRGAPGTAAVRDGITVVVGTADELRARFADVVPVTYELGIESVVAVPIRAVRGHAGSLTLWARTPRRFGPAEVDLLQAIAAQCGQAMRRAEGYDIEHRTSQLLQRRLLSGVPVLDERATIVTRYHPAGRDAAVGGDWYDVVHLGPDRLALVVGDVVGSGIDAAAIMGQLRSALKGAAIVLGEPVRVLEALDDIAAGIEGASGASACYVLLDLAAEQATVARAGHPPPLRLPAGGQPEAAFVEAPADPPIGFRREPRRSVTIDLASGDALLLYTDGLVERRDAGLDERLEQLRVAASAVDIDGGSLDAAVDEIVAACTAGERALRDDLAVLAARDEPAGPDRFRRLVPALARELQPLRAALRSWLVDERGLGGPLVDDVVLSAHEAATNAVEHAYRDVYASGGLVSVVASSTGGVVCVEVRDAGEWKPWPSETVRGRGLAIARALMDEVDVRTGPSGTAVSLRRSVGTSGGTTNT
jgi:PAS domain S-box-containing protein